MSKVLFFLFFVVATGTFGCAANIQEAITCQPSGAEIYWGADPDQLVDSGYTTPYSRTIPAGGRKKWCYQVRKGGYRDSEILCKDKESYRYFHFQLIPINTMITSYPPDAKILWGPTKDQIKETPYRTPYTTFDPSVGAGWKPWFFQVKKEGYNDSVIVFLPQQPKDRLVQFELTPASAAGAAQKTRPAPAKPHTLPPPEPNQPPPPELHSLPREFKISGDQVTLTWEDTSTDELGFKIEKKEGVNETYREIGTTGPNTTSYTDTGLQPGKTYFYRVRSYSASGNSPYSEEVIIKTLEE